MQFVKHARVLRKTIVPLARLDFSNYQINAIALVHLVITAIANAANAFHVLLIVTLVATMSVAQYVHPDMY